MQEIEEEERQLAEEAARAAEEAAAEEAARTAEEAAAEAKAAEDAAADKFLQDEARAEEEAAKAKATEEADAPRKADDAAAKKAEKEDQMEASNAGISLAEYKKIKAQREHQAQLQAQVDADEADELEAAKVGLSLQIFRNVRAKKAKKAAQKAAADAAVVCENSQEEPSAPDMEPEQVQEEAAAPEVEQEEEEEEEEEAEEGIPSLLEDIEGASASASIPTPPCTEEPPPVEVSSTEEPPPVEVSSTEEPLPVEVSSTEAKSDAVKLVRMQELNKDLQAELMKSQKMVPVRMLMIMNFTFILLQMLRLKMVNGEINEELSTSQ